MSPRLLGILARNIVIIKYYTHCTLLRKGCCVHLLEMCPFTLCVVVLVFLFSISKQQQQTKNQMSTCRNERIEKHVGWTWRLLAVEWDRGSASHSSGLSSYWIYFLKRTGAAATTTKASTREKSSWESFSFSLRLLLRLGLKSFKKKKKMKKEEPVPPSSLYV